MNLLILGGTRFVGRHIVEQALQKGHHVTLFHRGQSNETLFEGQVQRVLGDRTKDLGALKDFQFDAIIDTCGYKPAQVEESAKQLLHVAPTYVFISTISVYARDAELTDENSPVAEPIWDDALAVDGETYGGFKVACEQAISNGWDANALTIIRPGVVVGPHDHTDRLTYWPVRMMRDEPVIVPSIEGCPYQGIDARDLGLFVVRCAAERISGTFNTVGPAEPTTFSEMLGIAHKTAGGRARMVPLTADQLKEHGVEYWSDLPMISGENPDDWKLMNLPCDRAKAAGLTHRSLETTMSDLVEWWNRERKGEELRAGWSRQKELEVLTKLGHGV